MVKWKTVKELQDIFIDSYINSKLSASLEKACSDEYELKRDYNGRQVLELLQNVDDVYNEPSPSKEKDAPSVKISYKNGILEVGNTGTSFTADTIERLCLGRASSKSTENIGNKGTGLRSLLNDAEWIEIHSGVFHIRFSEEYAQTLFDKYKNVEIIAEQIKNWKKHDYDLCFPIMNCPQEIEQINTNFDTLIRVKIKEENNTKDTSIINQLKQPFYKALLFLPNIRKIEVETDNEIKIYEKKVDGNNIISLSESSDTLHTYYVQNKTIPLSNKQANLIIAIPLDKDYDFLNETLYCYFPIRNFHTPVHALIHAPFQTNDSRDDIPNDDKQINKELLKQCLVFLKELAEKIANENKVSIDLPITTLTPTDNFSGSMWNSWSFNLKDFYIDLLKGAKLLPTVNNDLISIEDNPKYIEIDFPKEFYNEVFSKLLIRLSDDVYDFVIKLAYRCNYYYYNFLYQHNLEDLKDKINYLSNSFNVQTNVKIFLWWTEYLNKYSSTSSIFPNLLKDTTQNWIQGHSKVYIPTDTGVSVLPESLKWVNLCIINQEYVDELIKQIQEKYRQNWDKIKQGLAEKTSNKRLLDKYSDEYFPIKFKEQSESKFVIEDINKQINTKDKSITFLNWFFDKYKDKFENDSTLTEIEYNFIDSDDDIISSKKLYLGQEYGKELSEKLFQDTGYHAIAPLSVIFTGGADDEEQFVEFIKKCGVLVFPKIYTKDLAYSDYSFSNYIKNRDNYQYNINYLKTKTIDNFTNTLKRLSTKEIVQWFKEDENFNKLMTLSEDYGCYYSNKSNTAQHPIKSNEYIKYLLNTTKWIELGDNKYSPNQIVKYSRLKNKINDYYGISETALIELLGKNIVFDYKLDFKNSFSSFSDNAIHEFLLKLPDVDTNGEISVTLYEDIISHKKEIYPSYNNSNIKLFCLDGEFHLNTNIKYASRKIHRNLCEKSDLINIQPNRNTETIKNWFGVDKYKINLELDDYKTIDNSEEFIEEINEIKIATLSSLNDTNNFISKLKKLNIIPCYYIMAINTEKDNDKVEIENYNYIKHDGKYYIRISQDYNRNILEQSIDFCDNIIEIMEDYVTPQIDKNLIGRLISSSLTNKKKIIEEQFGIHRWNYAKDLLLQQKEINEPIINFFKNNGLEIDMQKQISNIDFSKNLSNCDYLILQKACLKINKDIEDINNYENSINIDVRENIRHEFNKFKELQLKKYRMIFYKLAKNNIDTEKKLFGNIQ